MYRYFFRFVVTTLTILTANLLTQAVSDYLISYKNHMRPVTFTFIAMGIIVVIFYPLFAKMEEWVKSLSMKVVKSGKSLAGKYLGLAMAFLTALCVLCYFYAKEWYHIDLAKALVNGTLGSYF
jgi:hypothetical protein